MADTHHSRPPRSTSECPAWCITDHAGDDAGHASNPTYVPVIAGSHGDRLRPDSTELLVATTRDEDGEDWTYIGPPDAVDVGLFLTPESAARLSRAVANHVVELAHNPAPGTIETDEPVD